MSSIANQNEMRRPPWFLKSLRHGIRRACSHLVSFQYENNPSVAFECFIAQRLLQRARLIDLNLAIKSAIR